MTKQKQGIALPKRRGVTLVEIAIVLVIIGLLLGGVLKGQELINNAKVRSIADRQNSLKVAWFSFIDRFQALPGDYAFAAQYIPGAGDGTGDGEIMENDSPLVFQHLTGAGYLRCPQCTSTVAVAPSADNSLQNTYGGVMGIFSDDSYASNTAITAAARLSSNTGPLMPSNIVAEVDRKLDDGIANTGDVRFNNWATNGISPTAKSCMTKKASEQDDGSLTSADIHYWRHSSAPVDQNCGASVNI